MSCSGRSDSSWIAWMKIVISSVDRSFFMFQFVTILALPVETEVVSSQSNDQVASKVSASALFIYVKSSALDLPIFLNCHFVGELHACSVGTNFTPHVITINAGEDVMMKVISFSQQGPRAICILSANGVISNVTLRQPDSSGGTLTYEGRFEILSLSGSFMLTESQGTRSRSGGMSVSLASPDGRVVGGAVAGLLVAAGPVQVVVGSFLPGNQQEQKPKKQKAESIPAIVTPAPSIVGVIPVNNAEKEGTDGHRQQNSSPLKPNTASSPFRRDNWPTIQEPINSTTDINISLPAS
ncbi:hypothetical protein CICLE_v10021116mg [Citrus x clementina]|uniref:AT-hook motif nuclear-localized protein n=2 Tax=Citrus TaxID=2706 RepID=A0A067HDE8_CITSI|nr:hypothetical protein CICLE_v10021116mg [Citrus x clementina]KDO85846.1 hypothetical protein CISIN_1g020353mg [Citrus sinensis]